MSDHRIPEEPTTMGGETEATGVVVEPRKRGKHAMSDDGSRVERAVVVTQTNTADERDEAVTLREEIASQDLDALRAEPRFVELSARLLGSTI